MMKAATGILAPAVIAAVLLGAVPAGWCAEGAPFHYRPAAERKPAARECEVAVYGGTPAGAAAAIVAARPGRKTLLLSFDGHVGGMTSGGLTATDLGMKESIGGLALDFHDRIGRKSGFSPSQAEALYLKMLEEAVPVCHSSSHVAFGSIRMEPVYMILGQSAGERA
jgi:NADPH-dependent 2,4-dienoyl-CoA reductase/sulfur reductase-like enzyme